LELLLTEINVGSSIKSLSFNAHRQLVAIGTERKLLIWDLEKLNQIVATSEYKIEYESFGKSTTEQPELKSTGFHRYTVVEWHNAESILLC
jgi:hypothetical protein